MQERYRVHYTRLVKSMIPIPSREGLPETTLRFIPVAELILRGQSYERSRLREGLGLRGRKGEGVKGTWFN